MLALALLVLLGACSASFGFQNKRKRGNTGCAFATAVDREEREPDDGDADVFDTFGATAPHVLQPRPTAAPFFFWSSLEPQPMAVIDASLHSTSIPGFPPASMPVFDADAPFVHGVESLHFGVPAATAPLPESVCGGHVIDEDVLRRFPGDAIDHARGAMHALAQSLSSDGSLRVNLAGDQAYVAALARAETREFAFAAGVLAAVRADCPRCLPPVFARVLDDPTDARLGLALGLEAAASAGSVFMATAMLAAAGWSIDFIGTDAIVAAAMAAVRRNHAHVLALLQRVCAGIDDLAVLLRVVVFAHDRAQAQRYFAANPADTELARRTDAAICSLERVQSFAPLSMAPIPDVQLRAVFSELSDVPYVPVPLAVRGAQWERHVAGAASDIAQHVATHLYSKSGFQSSSGPVADERAAIVHAALNGDKNQMLYGLYSLAAGPAYMRTAYNAAVAGALTTADASFFLIGAAGGAAEALTVAALRDFAASAAAKGRMLPVAMAVDTAGAAGHHVAAAALRSAIAAGRTRIVEYILLRFGSQAAQLLTAQ